MKLGQNKAGPGRCCGTAASEGCWTASSTWSFPQFVLVQQLRGKGRAVTEAENVASEVLVGFFPHHNSILMLLCLDTAQVMSFRPSFFINEREGLA